MHKVKYEAKYKESQCQAKNTKKRTKFSKQILKGNNNYPQ